MRSCSYIAHQTRDHESLSAHSLDCLCKTGPLPGQVTLRRHRNITPNLVDPVSFMEAVFQLLELVPVSLVPFLYLFTLVLVFLAPVSNLLTLAEQFSWLLFPMC